MNAKTEAAVIQHGLNLLEVFPNAAERDPVKLCKKLRRLEGKAAALGLRLCNGPEYAEGEAEQIGDEILSKVNEILGNDSDEAVPVFVNRDPRGYGLKVHERWQAGRPFVHYRDWGGYGIIAPDLTQK